MATVFGGIGSIFDNLFGGGSPQPFFATQLSSSQQTAATQAVSNLSSGDGQDTFAGGTTAFTSSDVVDTVAGGTTTDTSTDTSSLPLAGPTADGVSDVTTDSGTQVLTMGDSTTVQLVGVAPADQPKTGY